MRNLPTETPSRNLTRSVPLGGDVELRIEAIEEGGRAMLDLRLARRAPASADADPTTAPPGEWQTTAAGFRVPLALADAVADAIQRTTRQASQAALWREPRRPAGGAA